MHKVFHYSVTYKAKSLEASIFKTQVKKIIVKKTKQWCMKI